MPEGSEEKTNAEVFGLPFDRFEAAVNALVELRDTGKLLLFLTRRGAVKLVGDIEDFQKEFRNQAKDSLITLEQVKKAQDELRHLTSAILRMPDAEAVLDYLERFSSEDFTSRREPSLREAFRRHQRPKIEVVASKIVSEAIKQRAKRLATATGACVEELDYEVVSEREDSYRMRSVKDPFLRLRLRYSDSSSFQPFVFMFAPFEGPETNPALGFEFECDLSDIDLLLKRLNEAKQRLLKIQERESEEH